MAELKVEVAPLGPSARDVEAAANAALDHPAVTAELDGAEHRLLSVAPVEREPDPGDEDAPEPTRVRTGKDQGNFRGVAIYSCRTAGSPPAPSPGRTRFAG